MLTLRFIQQILTNKIDSSSVSFCLFHKPNRMLAVNSFGAWRCRMNWCFKKGGRSLVTDKGEIKANKYQSASTSEDEQ